MTRIHRAATAALPKLAVAILLALAGCRSNSDLSTGPSQLVIVAGADQQAAVGTSVGTAPAVRVQDASGAAISGVTVKFTVTTGGGTILGDSVVTDVNGRAATSQWVLGTAPGTNTLHAQVVSTSVSTNITATAVPGLAVTVRASGQQGFIALVSQAVAPAPAAVAIDSYGNPVPGTVVTFVVISGGGSVTGATAAANSAGVAQLGSWTLGSAVGANTIQARIPTGAAVTFTAQALTSAPTLQATSSTSQSGYLQYPVTSIPRVKVVNALGAALPGVPVTFTVSGGDGTVTGPIGITGSDGVASPADWRLGQTPGTVTASTGLGATPILFNATGVTAPFVIDVRFLTTVNADQRDAFIAAAQRWMSIITAHLTSVPINLPAGACSTLQPAMNELVTDLVIFAEVSPIDGVGNILGSASPCASRSSSGLTIVGTMQFDSADLQALVTTNQLVPTITHEMAHVLGFGTAWSSRSLTTGIGGSDPRFIGGEAVSIWPPFQAALGFSGATPPLENLGGAGTAGSHWRESVFHAELMTGYIEAPGVPMPLSRMTIATMKDLGYSVDYSQADTFVGHLLAAGSTAQPATQINERIGSPRFFVTPVGITERVQ